MRPKKILVGMIWFLLTTRRNIEYEIFFVFVRFIDVSSCLLLFFRAWDVGMWRDGIRGFFMKESRALS
jgi:hypothetical protein